MKKRTKPCVFREGNMIGDSDWASLASESILGGFPALPFHQNGV